MKPFDLKKALAGEKVVTSKGEPVTQITAFDVTGAEFSLRGVLNNQIGVWNRNGEPPSAASRDSKLYMAPKDCYIHIYAVDNGTGWAMEGPWPEPDFYAPLLGRNYIKRNVKIEV